MNFLVDLIPAKGRKYLYAGLAFVAAVFGIWKATNGDWDQFAISFLTTFVNTLAASNTNTSKVESKSSDADSSDGPGTE